MRMRGYFDEVHNLKAWSVTLEFEEKLDVLIREISPSLNTMKVEINGKIGPEGLKRLAGLLLSISREANTK